MKYDKILIIENTESKQKNEIQYQADNTNNRIRVMIYDIQKYYCLTINSFRDDQRFNLKRKFKDFLVRIKRNIMIIYN